MKKIYCFLLAPLLAPDFAGATGFVGNFKGFYGGPSASFGRTRIGVNDQRYRKTRLLIGGLLGYGHVFKESNLYFGNEVGFLYDTFSQKIDGQRIEKMGHIEDVIRFGEIIQNNFLPYIGVGGFYGKYRLKNGTINRHYRMAGWIGEVGVDAFLRPNVTIRSSLRYQRGVKAYRTNDQVQTQKNPQEVLLKIGISFHIN